MQTPKKLVLTTEMPIRWGDMDAYGHVNNTVYFRYAEQARVEWLEGMGYTVLPIGGAPVIINTHCTFLLPLTYPGTVDVRLFAGKLGRSSLETVFEIRLKGSDTLYAEGGAKIVWMDAATGKSVPIPDALRAIAE